MYKIVLFIEPSDDAFNMSFKIGYLFMNRFAIDEEATFEILKIFELAKSSSKMSDPRRREYDNFEHERELKGKILSAQVSEVLFLVINCFKQLACT